jgi:Holliday junction resolvasome RuvABC endonuclease subunit
MARRKKLNKEEQNIFFSSNSKIAKQQLEKPIVGIDIGTFLTGFYSKTLDAVTIQGGKKLSLIERISAIKTELFVLLSKLEHSPVVFIEDYAWGKNNASITQLAELGGNIKLLLFESGIYYMCVAPSTLKKFVLGPKRGVLGEGHKAVTMVTVLDRWGKKFSDDNACDAYCLYRFGRALKAFIKNPNSAEKWEAEMFREFVIHRAA